MSAAIPRSKPKATLTEVMSAAKKVWGAGRPELPPTFVVAIRAYYEDSMGVVDQNDVGMYDDAFFIVTPFGFSAWNGNTDPSRYGWNANAGKYMARLKSNRVYEFVHLKHHASRPDGYMAFGQGEHPVVVERVKSDGSIAQTESGCFGINLHRGGISGTSSEGCNTVPREQWPDFYKELHDALVKTSQKTFPFILVEGPIN